MGSSNLYLTAKIRDHSKNMYVQIRQVFHPSSPHPLRILTRLTSLTQVMYDFTSVRTLWLISNNTHFTCFCFTYSSSTPCLYSQFAYYRARVALVYFFC